MSWAEQAAAAWLEDDNLLLRPVRTEDRKAIYDIAMDSHIWRYFVFRVQTDEEFDTFFAAMLADLQARSRVPYVVIAKASGRIAGSMSFGNFAEPDGRLEIGWSWLGRDFRGRGINRPTKRLLLRFAFENLGAQRVEFKTDVLNEQARAGLLGIGAVEEGVLRSYNPMPDGRRRDAIFFSVLGAEWLGVNRILGAASGAVPQ